MTDNEWARAANLRDQYWLYVVFNCATPNPELLRVRDPFARLTGREGGPNPEGRRPRRHGRERPSMSTKRLIETAFPLAETSAASLHEKNMRHGHISTLHLWPARRPLAASRAAIAAALLPDPGNDVERARLVRRLGAISATLGPVLN